MGHLSKECLLSRKVPVHVAKDELQTSLGAPWVEVAKRHMIKKTSQNKSKWQPKKDNVYNLLTDIGERQAQLKKDLGKRQVLPMNVMARRLCKKYSRNWMILISMSSHTVRNIRKDVAPK